MKPYVLIVILFLSISLFATECEEIKKAFEKEERAYEMVSRVAVPSMRAYEIIGRYIDQGQQLLQECPKSYTLDRQYTLKRQLQKAWYTRNRYKVFTQSQVKGYAISHPQEQVVYRWATVKITP